MNDATRVEVSISSMWVKGNSKILCLQWQEGKLDLWETMNADPSSSIDRQFYLDPFLHFILFPNGMDHINLIISKKFHTTLKSWKNAPNENTWLIICCRPFSQLKLNSLSSVPVKLEKHSSVPCGHKCEGLHAVCRSVYCKISISI